MMRSSSGSSGAEKLESIDGMGTGMDVTCAADTSSSASTSSSTNGGEGASAGSALQQVGALAVLISPFFFWGTSMVAMKASLPLCPTHICHAMLAMLSCGTFAHANICKSCHAMYTSLSHVTLDEHINVFKSLGLKPKHVC